MTYLEVIDFSWLYKAKNKFQEKCLKILKVILKRKMIVELSIIMWFAGQLSAA